ncbi:hypothetical protein LJB90_01865 [Eubacteriales bacterium OttesenSCG-928-G02]|nr:hypothetical protein [Eubacteriales bacterium OttesenSCG-928-G02]
MLEKNILSDILQNINIKPSVAVQKTKRLKDEEYLFERKKEKLIASLSKDAQEAFEELFEIGASLLCTYNELNIATGICIANSLHRMMNNPFEALDALQSTYYNLEEQHKCSINKINNYLNNTGRTK